jgi:hypothetical protein
MSEAYAFAKAREAREIDEEDSIQSSEYEATRERHLSNILKHRHQLWT